MTQPNNGPQYPNQNRQGGPNQQNSNPNNPYQQAYQAGYQQGFNNARNAQGSPNNQYNGETFGQPGPNFGPRNNQETAWQRFGEREQFHWDLGSIARSTLKATRNTLVWGGVILLIVGILLLIFPAQSILVSTILVGILFGIVGVARIVTAFASSGTPTGWRVLDGLAGLLLILSCVLIFRHLYASTDVLMMMITITLGISWIVEGCATLVEGAGFMGTGWSIFSAVISILGGTVLLFWPVSSMPALILYVAIMLIVYGIIAFVRGLNMPKIK